MEKIKLNIQLFASNGCTITVVSCTPSSASDNYSTIKIRGKLTTGSSTYNYGGAYMQPVISNQPVVGSQTSSQTLSKKKYSIGTNGTKEDTWTFKVYHNDDGTCNNLTIKIKWYVTDNTNGTTTLSGGYTPATIARASSLTATNGTLNSSNSVSIAITRKNDTFTHTLRYVCGTASGWIKDSNNKVATGATWTPPLSLASQNQSGSSISCRIHCQTYDGDTTVGSETYKDITLTIPTLNPTASLSSISDSTSYKSTYGVFIQNKSKISATLGGTAQYSTINTYNWEIRKTNSSGTLLASGSGTSISYTPTTSGTLYIKGTVKDKRGAQNSTSTTVSITAYNPPKCSLAVSRTGDTTASYTMSGSGSPINQSGYTANTVTYLLKRDSTQIRSTNSGTSYTDTDSDITANSSYTYTLTATDTISGTADTKTVSISTTFTLMNFSATGYGLSIGKASEVTGETKLFEVALPSEFIEDVTVLNNFEVQGGSVVQGNSSIAGDTYIGGNLKVGKRLETDPSNAFQTTIFGTNKDGYRLKTIRSGVDGATGFKRDSTGIAFSAGDTHGYVYTEYLSTGNAWMGGGNNNKLNWKKRVFFYEDILNFFYPVGSIYIMPTNTSPATLFGGTWELVDKHFKSHVGKTDGTTYFTPASGITSSGSYVMRNGHTLWIRQTVLLNKAANDDGFDLGTFNLAELGVTDTYCSFLNQLSFSDGGNSGIVWSFTYNTGVVKQIDVFNKTSISSGTSFYLLLNFSVPMSCMLDSACDKFFWKRIS